MKKSRMSKEDTKTAIIASGIATAVIMTLVVLSAMLQGGVIGQEFMQEFFEPDQKKPITAVPYKVETPQQKAISLKREEIFILSAKIKDYKERLWIVKERSTPNLSREVERMQEERNLKVVIGLLEVDLKRKQGELNQMMTDYRSNPG